MSTQQHRAADPFRCFVGCRVQIESLPHVVEGYEVHGCDLLFRLRRLTSGHELRVTVVQLLELLERQEA